MSSKMTDAIEKNDNGYYGVEDNGSVVLGENSLIKDNDFIIHSTLSASSGADAEERSEGNDDDVRLENPRKRAVMEAEATLEAMGGASCLDGFNLLGVIANPRGGSLLSASTSAALSAASASTAYHGRYQSNPSVLSRHDNQHHHNSYHHASDVLTDTYLSLESTLSSVTEQLEVLNAVLEDWSRQLLEDGPGRRLHGDDYLPESMLLELPWELRNLDLQSLQSYLESSGVAAHAFQHRHAQPDTKTERALSATISQREVEQEIPPPFFQIDFDLTDPATFQKFLMANNDETSLTQSFDEDLTSKNIHFWFPLQQQEAFSGLLDKVEIALLQQVRSRSDAFFEESLRFAQLQEWIQGLLKQVMELQRVAMLLNQNLLEPVESVPLHDTQRASLQSLIDVLDSANDLFRCKSSIGGLLSAQDDLSAIEQIQFGRKLLAGEAILSFSSIQETTSLSAAYDNPIDLRRLLALKSVSDQLKQYEQLVVTNLREELVEIFLDWNTAAVSSKYAVNGGNLETSMGTSSSHSLHKPSHQVNQRVLEIYGALRMCRALHQTRVAYSKRLQDMIRMTVRATVGEFAADSISIGTTSAIASISTGATAMSLARFLDCLDLLFEQLLALITSASGVSSFCLSENFSFDDATDENDTFDSTLSKALETSLPTDHSDASDVVVTKRETSMAGIVSAAAELSAKSISELLRLRKEVHSQISLDDVKKIWDKCLSFSTHVEELSGHKAVALRSTLLAQIKAFVENKHERDMSALVAALDSERWTQCDVSFERQETLTRLCQGRSVALQFSSLRRTSTVDNKSNEAEVEGARYKVVWSCLLLVEMMTVNIGAATYFSSFAPNLIAKVGELLRLFNTRTTHLVLGAGAIHSNAKLKSINAKHLSLVTQCLGLIMSILPHVRAAFMSQMPQKQHTLLTIFDQIKKEYADHNEKLLNKFVTIIGGIVEHGLAPKIFEIDFDSRAQLPPPSMNAEGEIIACCEFLRGISVNIKKMHQVLESLLPPDHLQDVFSRIFSFVDQKIPNLFKSATETRPAVKSSSVSGASFSFPTTDEGKRRFLLELEVMATALNGLAGVYPWDFTLVHVFEKQLEFQLISSAKGEKQHDAITEPREKEQTSGIATAIETGDDDTHDDCQNPAVFAENELEPQPSESVHTKPLIETRQSNGDGFVNGQSEITPL